jgi:hypothetical protein
MQATTTDTEKSSEDSEHWRGNPAPGDPSKFLDEQNAEAASDITSMK